MTKIFTGIAPNRVGRNKFNLSHEKKLTCNMGFLIPTLVQDVVPGDKFRVNTEIMIRFAPLLAPVMHRINVYTHYFFVPNRIVWEDWEDFITGGEDGLQAPVHPYLSINTTDIDLYRKRTLADYLGIPAIEESISTITDAQKVSALPFRAYQSIYNEYYRDQNVITKLDIDKSSGEVTDPTQIALLTKLQKRAWEKDYFTSCLPWAQRGAEVATPVTYDDHTRLLNQDGSEPTPPVSLSGLASGGETWLDGNGNWMQTENISGININDLRKASRLQEWLERSARGGARYIEQILSHFGVRSSDARLQRPEYLGGGRNNVVISEVLNTTGQVDPTTGDPVGNVQGTMAGHGISVGGQHRFKKYFEEHGYVICMMSVLPRTAYQQGLQRHWQKFDKLDHYFPEFAHLGEQQVLQKELKFDPEQASTINEATFGYQQRYAEYKYMFDQCHGDMRDNLDYWHLVRQFAGDPALNESFIQASVSDRIFAVSDSNATDKLWIQLYNNVSALRKMPYYGTPYL